MIGNSTISLHFCWVYEAWYEKSHSSIRSAIDKENDPKSFSYSDLKAFRPIERVSDFHCVEGWSVPDIQWGGFRFSEILSHVAPKPQAEHIAFHSFGKTSAAPKGQAHYIESLPIVDPGQFYVSHASQSPCKPVEKEKLMP
jgi:hypothetical protein